MGLNEQQINYCDEREWPTHFGAHASAGRVVGSNCNKGCQQPTQQRCYRSPPRPLGSSSHFSANQFPSESSGSALEIALCFPTLRTPAKAHLAGSAIREPPKNRVGAFRNRRVARSTDPTRRERVYASATQLRRQECSVVQLRSK